MSVQRKCQAELFYSVHSQGDIHEVNRTFLHTGLRVFTRYPYSFSTPVLTVAGSIDTGSHCHYRTEKNFRVH